jgi:hypothetical protein
MRLGPPAAVTRKEIVGSGSTQLAGNLWVPGPIRSGHARERQGVNLCIKMLNC